MGLSQFQALPLEPGTELILPIMWFDDEIRMAPDAKLPLMLGEALSTPSAMVLANALLSGGTLAIQLALVLAYLGWKRHFFDDYHTKLMAAPPSYPADCHHDQDGQPNVCQDVDGNI